MLPDFDDTFLVVEILSVVDAHLRVDVPLLVPYLADIVILRMFDTRTRRSCPMAAIFAELMQGKHLLDDAIPA